MMKNIVCLKSLYKRDSKGKIRIWTVEVGYDNEDEDFDLDITIDDYIKVGADEEFINGLTLRLNYFGTGVGFNKKNMIKIC